jgi:hypothetical protein
MNKGRDPDYLLHRGFASRTCHSAASVQKV